jgi:hypothetical protein
MNFSCFPSNFIDPFGSTVVPLHKREKESDSMEKHYPSDSVFVTGVAKVSRDDVINSMYGGTFSLSLVIDRNTGTIIHCSANMIMADTIAFLQDILIGKNLLADVETMVQELRRRFLALSQKAVIAALKDAQNHYLNVYPTAGNQ